MSPEQRAIAKHLSKARPQMDDCACMGPLSLGDGSTAPVCHCAMKRVEAVDGHFFKIEEARDLTFTARDMGPVGGPYLCDTKGRFPN